MLAVLSARNANYFLNSSKSACDNTPWPTELSDMQNTQRSGEYVYNLTDHKEAYFLNTLPSGHAEMRD